MGYDAAILYKLNKKVYMISVAAGSTASVLRVLEDKLELTVFGIKTRTFESVFINNEKMLHFFATKKKRHNDIVVREGIFVHPIVSFRAFNLLCFFNFIVLLSIYIISYTVRKAVALYNCI